MRHLHEQYKSIPFMSSYIQCLFAVVFWNRLLGNIQFREAALSWYWEPTNTSTY